MSVKDRLRDLRESKNIKQSTLADELGYSQQAISRIETGKTYADERVLTKIADYFDVSVDYLIGKSDVKNVVKNMDSLNSMVISNLEIIELINGMDYKNKSIILEICKILIKDNTDNSSKKFNK